MRFENVLQIIVPLTFLAIWALTSLFNREAQPLPPRPNRVPPPGPPGPRPNGQRRIEPSPRDPAARWQTSGPPPTRPNGRRPGPGNMSDAEIIILESETRRPAVPPAPPRPGAGPSQSPKRGGRPRQTPITPTKRPEPATPRALTASLAQETASLGRMADLTPLGRGKSTLTVPEGLGITKVETPNENPKEVPAAMDWVHSPMSVQRLRDAIIANEILSPPLALRPRQPRTRHY